MANWDSGNSDLENRMQVKKEQENQEFENGLADFITSKNPVQSITNQTGTGNDPFAPVGLNTTPLNSLNTVNGGVNMQQNPQPNQQQPQRQGLTREEMTLLAFKGVAKGSTNLFRFLWSLVPFIREELLKDVLTLRNFYNYGLKLNATLGLATFVLGFFLGGSFWLMLTPFAVWTGTFTIGYLYILLFKTAELEAALGGDIEEEVEDTQQEGFNQQPVYQNFNDTQPTSFDSFEEPSSSASGFDFEDDEEEFGEEPDVEEFEEFEDDEYEEFEEFEDEFEDEFDDEFGEDYEDDFKPARKSIPLTNAQMQTTIGEGDEILVDEGAIENQLSTLSTISHGLLSRRLLLDAYLNMLDKSNIKFDYERRLDIAGRDNNEALSLEAFINNAIEAIGLGEDSWIIVKSVVEKLMTFQIITTFPQKLKGGNKLSLVGEELTKVLRDRMSRTLGDSVRAVVTNIGNEIRVSIYKGMSSKTYLSGLLDSQEARSYLEDTNNLLPVILGYDGEGNLIKTDMAKSISVLISGKADSGKSNFGTVIMSQLTALNSPNHIQLVVGDVKGKLSDWHGITSPHLRRFESNPIGILQMMNWLVHVESKRRINLMDSENVKDIKDYNKKAENPLPFLFVVLDEVISFSQRATKEQMQEYRRYLKIMISEFRYVGIFPMLIVHDLLDEYIPASVGRMLHNKFAVRPDEDMLDHIWKKKRAGVSAPNKGDFIYELLGKSELSFGHAPVLMAGDSADGRLDILHEAQRKLWYELEPDTIAGSYYDQSVQSSKQLDIFGKSNLDISEDDMKLEDAISERDKWLEENLP